MLIITSSALINSSQTVIYRPAWNVFKTKNNKTNILLLFATINSAQITLYEPETICLIITIIKQKVYYHCME